MAACGSLWQPVAPDWNPFKTFTGRKARQAGQAGRAGARRFDILWQPVATCGNLWRRIGTPLKPLQAGGLGRQGRQGRQAGMAGRKASRQAGRQAGRQAVLAGWRLGGAGSLDVDCNDDGRGDWKEFCDGRSEG